MRANWPVRAEAARQNGVASLIPMLEKVFFTQASLDENGPNVRHVKEKWAACSGEGYALGCEWLAMVDAREQARRMTHADADHARLQRGPALQGRGRAGWPRTFPGSKGIVEVPMAGHASVRERPDFVAAGVQAFPELTQQPFGFAAVIAGVAPLQCAPLLMLMRTASGPLAHASERASSLARSG